MRFRKALRFGAFALLVIGFLFLSVSTFKAQGPSVSATEETLTNKITVTGEGVAKLKADTVEITLGVQSDGKTAQEAQGNNSVLMNGVIRALKNMLTPDDRWETVFVSLTPQYDYSEEGKGQLIGFRADNSILITLTNIERAGEIIDACVSAGANTISSIQFSLKDMEKIKLDAIKLAMENAEGKANSALQAIGKSITSVEKIDVSDAYYPPIRYAFEAKGYGAAPATPIEPGMMEVRVSVTVTYTF